MDELGSLIQGLPGWAQTVIVMAVLVLGAIFGAKRQRRRGGQRNAGREHSTLTGGRKKQPERPRRRSGERSPAEEPSPGQAGPAATRDLPGHVVNTLTMTYAPSSDGTPDPGEVVWTWVPFVEYDGRGKDRPVLIVGRLDDESVAGYYLSTKSHRGFIPVGSGPWDSQGRPSYLNPERVLRVTDGGMRREGAVMRREQFEAVVAQLR